MWLIVLSLMQLTQILGSCCLLASRPGAEGVEISKAQSRHPLKTQSCHPLKTQSRRCSQLGEEGDG